MESMAEKACHCDCSSPGSAANPISLEDDSESLYATDDGGESNKENAPVRGSLIPIEEEVPVDRAESPPVAAPVENEVLVPVRTLVARVTFSLVSPRNLTRSPPKPALNYVT